MTQEQINTHLPNVLAMVQGSESHYTITTPREIWVQLYEKAVDASNNNYRAIHNGNNWTMKQVTVWNRRVR